MAKQPSKPRLKRRIFRQVELGVYLGEPDRLRFVSWWADLPGGRGVTGVQKVTDPKRLGNEKRNPVLYRHEYNASYLCGIDGHKKVSILGGHALYLAIRDELAKITRRVVKACGEDGSHWETLDRGPVRGCSAAGAPRCWRGSQTTTAFGITAILCRCSTRSRRSKRYGRSGPCLALPFKTHD
jgi:hypothetical protein